MENPSKIAPAKGRLGVLLPGMGAGSKSVMGGVELVRKGQSQPVGSLTQMGTIRVGKRTDARSPLIKKFVPLAELSELTFGGWDIFKDNAYQSAANAGVLNPQDLEKVKPFLSTIKPMKAAFDHDFVKLIDGPNIKKGKNKYELALQIKEDIENFRKTSRVSRMVTCWCGSTESFVKPEEVHSTPGKFVEAMTAKFSRTRARSRQKKSPSSVFWNIFSSRSCIRSCTGRCTIRCASTTIRRVVTTKKAGTTSIFSAGSVTPCKSRWISFVAIPSWPRRSCSISCYSLTWHNARACAASRSGSAFTSSRR